jgi:hypothetical protein
MIKAMKKLLSLFAIICVLVCSGCSVTLNAPMVTMHSSLVGYKYVYINHTKEKVSTLGVSSAYTNYAHSAILTQSVNPADVISGILIKEGYVILHQYDPTLADSTLIVNYGESGKRDVGLGYTLEVTIQFVSAKTNKLVCSCTAEGIGSTEAEDIRNAITRALSSVFDSSN